jgi:hypothetical protein
MIDDGVEILIQTQGKDLADLLVQDVVEGVILEEKEQFVIYVTLGKGHVDVGMMGGVEIGEELHYGYP